MDRALYLILYVDDMLIAWKSLHEISRMKALLRKEFDIKDLGAARKMLGMEIHRDRESVCLWLTQRGCLEKIVDLFSMSSAKVVSTLARHFKLSRAQCPMIEADIAEMKQTPYASIVSFFMYAMVCTRLDISNAVGIVSKFMSNPRKEHCKMR